MDSNEADINQSALNEVPDLQPVELPGRNIAPSIEDRVAALEDVLHIN